MRARARWFTRASLVISATSAQNNCKSLNERWQMKIIIANNDRWNAEWPSNPLETEMSRAKLVLRRLWLTIYLNKQFSTDNTIETAERTWHKFLGGDLTALGWFTLLSAVATAHVRTHARRETCACLAVATRRGVRAWICVETFILRPTCRTHGTLKNSYLWMKLQ